MTKKVKESEVDLAQIEKHWKKMSNYNFYSISFTDSVVLKAFINSYI